MFNYGVGRMGKMEWIEKYLHVKKKSLDKAERFMAGRGAWMGFFAFLPLLGSAITIVLGLTRANIPISILSITIGKVLRYVLLVYGTQFHRLIMKRFFIPYYNMRPNGWLQKQPAKGWHG